MRPILRQGLGFDPATERAFKGLETLFERAFGEDGQRCQTPPNTWSNFPLAIWEDEDSLHVEAEMPGVKEEDLDVTVHQGMLFIRGERKPDEGRKYLYDARFRGKFERTVALPDTVGSEEVEANFTDGVLLVTLRKRVESKPRKVSVKTS